MLAKLGKCPRAWITELKGKRAIELLRNGSNVNETADRLATSTPATSQRGLECVMKMTENCTWSVISQSCAMAS